MQVSARAATTPADISQSYVLDLNAVESLKTSAKHDPKNAIKQVASQFEAMFLNTLMKTMRQTSFDGEEDSNALDTYQGMFDQQLVQQLAGSGRGTGSRCTGSAGRSRRFHLDARLRKLGQCSFQC